ncbi:hypothetical protein DPMN_063783 [Dreissena polymorpha]|uniref:Uncharacterized protein n=1 Tax=Dreissena polymorpha TaxID=45954 RepID=A0A9D4HKK0_DREPO|nr:hypothetical protein DPMN_063783 [Dreissena polymorpha]
MRLSSEKTECIGNASFLLLYSTTSFRRTTCGSWWKACIYTPSSTCLSFPRGVTLSGTTCSDGEHHCSVYCLGW